MRHKVITFSLLFVSWFYAVHLHSEDRKLRIQELIPDSWIEFPAIEPAIPSNYVSKELPTTGHVVWGTPEDVASFTKNEPPIQSEVIIMRHSTDVAQIDLDRFSGEDELKQMARQLGICQFRQEKLKWGDYPVLAMSGRSSDGKLIHMAWVGLNSPSGITLFVRHQPPTSNGECCDVWDHFLHQTTQLDELDLFRVKGMDMKDGYTTFSKASASLKIAAERRRSDSLLAVRIEPLTPNTTFELETIEENRMGCAWKCGEPITLVFGVMTETEGRYGTCITDSLIVVLTKEVDDFSFSLEEDAEGVVIRRL